MLMMLLLLLMMMMMMMMMMKTDKIKALLHREVFTKGSLYTKRTAFTQRHKPNSRWTEGLLQTETLTG